MRFNTETQTYESDTGETILDSVIRTSVVEVGEDIGNKLRSVFDLYIGGELDALQLRWRGKEILKDAHGTTFLIGIGGKNNATSYDWLAEGRELKFQYDRLTSLIVDIQMERVSEAAARNRLQLFSRSVKGSYELGRRLGHTRAGFILERRIRTKQESCVECLNYAAAGWVDIGTLPEPTKVCTCRTNCGCYKQFSRTNEGTDYVRNTRHPLSSWNTSDRLKQSLRDHSFQL